MPRSSLVTVPCLIALCFVATAQQKARLVKPGFSSTDWLIRQVVDLCGPVLTQQIQQQRHPPLGAFRGIRRQVVAQGIALVVLIAKIDDEHGSRGSRHFSIIQRDTRQIFSSQLTATVRRVDSAIRPTPALSAAPNSSTNSEPHAARDSCLAASSAASRAFCSASALSFSTFCTACW